MTDGATSIPRLEWRGLWLHSYRLGVRWLLAQAGRGWPARRLGLARLLVPMDPWRYYELGILAAQRYSGDCLDISGPKLLTSLLHRQGRGRWVGVDLYEQEIHNWRVLDPSLILEVQDATQLTYPPDSFDVCCSVSVLEHLRPPKDEAAIDEIWRVLKPGGIAHITTDVALAPVDHFVDQPIYGEASLIDGRGVFFKHDFSPDELLASCTRHGWVIEESQYAVQNHEWIERWFYRLAPLSYLVGGLLALVCPGNFRVSSAPGLLQGATHGVAYLRLRKPLGGAR